VGHYDGDEIRADAARCIQDRVVQRLVIAQLALDLDEVQHARTAIVDALVAAKRVVGDLLETLDAPWYLPQPVEVID